MSENVEYMHNWFIGFPEFAEFWQADFFWDGGGGGGRNAYVLLLTYFLDLRACHL